jgi:hypothetical protein
MMNFVIGWPPPSLSGEELGRRPLRPKNKTKLFKKMISNAACRVSNIKMEIGKVFDFNARQAHKPCIDDEFWHAENSKLKLKVKL